MIAFVLLLPAATWLLGAVLSLLDRPDYPAAMRRLAVAGLPFLAAMLVLGRAASGPAIAALSVAAILHGTWSMLLPAAIRRGWLVGTEAD